MSSTAKNKDPLVSVIMNCYNGQRFLQEAIQSVYNQTYNNWEIIFWDNLSEDSSPEIANSYDHKLKYFKSNKFLSLGLARKEAVKKASGEFIAILDVDDLWREDKLKKEIEVFEKNKNWSVLYSNCQGIDTNGKNLGDPHVKKFFSGNIFYNIIREEITIPWPSFIARHKAIISVGSFRDFKHAEDKDILLRLAHKYKFGYINKVLSNYRMHPQQLSINFEISLRETIQISNFWKKN